MTPLLRLVVLVSATLIDFAHARCVVAIAERAPHRAATWSIVQCVAEPMRSGRIPIEVVTSAMRKMNASTTASTATSSTWS